MIGGTTSHIVPPGLSFRKRTKAMRNQPQSILLTLALSLLVPASLPAELSLPGFFSDHMVLQRERPAAIWGKAEPEAKVAVAFKGETASAKADAEGRWRAAIKTGAADAKGAELTVTSAGEAKPTSYLASSSGMHHRS